MSDREPVTRAQWRAMSAYEKGYAVYMAGERDDEPNVPATYRPRLADRPEYVRGLHAALLVAQDCP